MEKEEKRVPQSYFHCYHSRYCWVLNFQFMSGVKNGRILQDVFMCTRFKTFKWKVGHDESKEQVLLWKKGETKNVSSLHSRIQNIREKKRHWPVTIFFVFLSGERFFYGAGVSLGKEKEGRLRLRTSSSQNLVWASAEDQADASG